MTCDQFVGRLEELMVGDLRVATVTRMQRHARGS